MSQKMKHGQGLSISGRDYHIRYLSVLAGIGGVMLIRHIINDSLGGLCICISQSMSPGASMSLRCGVSGLLLQAVSTSVLLEVRRSQRWSKNVHSSQSYWVIEVGPTTRTDNSWLCCAEIMIHCYIIYPSTFPLVHIYCA